METNPYPNPHAVFPQTVSAAIVQLKQRLQSDYEQAYPDLREIIHLVLDDEETKAWALSPFPHLLLPDLVEAHIARLNLEPAEAKHDNVFAAYPFNEIGADERAFALCG
jgi:hypothetical protein